MKKIRLFTVVAVMTLISSGVFNGCKKEKEEALLSEVSNKTSSIQKNLLDCYNDEVLDRNAPIGDWAYFRNIGHEFNAYGTQIYFALSMDYNRGYLRYGFITEANNYDAYHCITDRFEWIFNGEALEGNSEIEAHEFYEIEEALDFAQMKLKENRDIMMFQLEDGRFIVIVEQEQRCFVIITENEMQFLGNPEPIEEFRVNVSSYIDVAVDMMDCYFVFHIDNGIVKNGQVGKNPTSPIHNSWSNRLRGYIEIARDYPIIDIPVLDGVCQTYEKKSTAKQVMNSLLDRDDVESVCMTKNEDGTYTVCWEYKK